jgi:hypothetical protein
MNRPLKRELEYTTFDAAVIGRGVIGAGIARDAATRGSVVALSKKVISAAEPRKKLVYRTGSVFHFGHAALPRLYKCCVIPVHGRSQVKYGDVRQFFKIAMMRRTETDLDKKQSP